NVVTRLVDRCQIRVFYELPVTQVVAQNERGAHSIGRRGVPRQATLQQAFTQLLEAPVKTRGASRPAPAHAQPERPLRMHQVINNGATHFHSKIETWTRAFAVIGYVLEIVQYVDTAHETDGTVNHTGFAVHAPEAAQVENRLPQPCGFGPVHPVPNPALAEKVTDVVGGFIAAEAIKHHPHLDPSRLRPAQGVHDPATGRIKVENVGFQVDGTPCAVNGLDQRREILPAILQQANIVAFPPPQLKRALNHDDSPAGRTRQCSS